MEGHHLLVALAVLALASSLSTAYDPSPLQDYCVGTNKTKDHVFVNGEFCKDPKLATANDFFFSGLHIPGNTSKPFGVALTFANVEQIPGLNTLGISMSRVDIAPGGVNSPHYHPRGSEIIVVMKGHVLAGFVTSNPEYRLFTKTLKPGDAFVFPLGLIHFQYNVGKTNAYFYASFSSQSAGLIRVTNSVFGSNPAIGPDVLTESFKLNKKIVNYLQKLFEGNYD